MTRQFQHLCDAAPALAPPTAVAVATSCVPSTAARMEFWVAVRLLDVTLGPEPGLNCSRRLSSLCPLDGFAAVGAALVRSGLSTWLMPCTIICRTDRQQLCEGSLQQHCVGVSAAPVPAMSGSQHGRKGPGCARKSGLYKSCASNGHGRGVAQPVICLKQHCC